MIATLIPSRVACNARSEPLSPTSGVPGPHAPTDSELNRTMAANICRVTISRSKCDDFSRIHQVLRVECVLDRAHYSKRRTVLGFQVFHLALPDPVLAGAGSLHRKGTLDQAFAELLCGLDFGGIVKVDKRRDMEIAITHVTDDRRHKPVLLD